MCTSIIHEHTLSILVQWLSNLFAVVCGNFKQSLPAEASKLHKSTPIPRPKLGTKSWGVRLGQDGLLDVADKPPARQRTLEILSSVLDSGHELDEAEMVELFDSRGADFDAVCSAAGISTLILMLALLQSSFEILYKADNS